ncbi:MAG: nuclear transport factor 2 family protein [Caulobacterales bacterium]
MSKFTLETLAAEAEINQVLRNYCRSMDRIDCELGHTVWHEDGTADYGPIYSGSGRGFIDMIAGFHRNLASHFHQIGNTTIELRGDRATSETYVTVALLAKPDGGKQTLTTGRGRYLDKWSRRNGRWAIDHRHFVLDFAFNQDVEAQMGSGARDTTDAAYALFGAA